MPKQPTKDLVGELILGRYQVISLLQVGGMGAVYEVSHKNLGRRFAAKMLSPDLSRDADALTRFRREADIIARLRHPNIVDVADWDLLEDGSPVLVMELLRGDTLAERIAREGPLPWKMFAEVADRVLSALQVAHAAGIVHRDLKPSNIFLSLDDAGEMHPKVLDFGVSKISDTQTMTTTNPTILGTPSYMSPEQAEGRSNAVGPATDVWAMGAVLYEMATAQIAFWAESVPSILYQVCHGKPVPLRSLRQDAPEALDMVISRALSRDRDIRIRDASRFRREVRAALLPLLGDVHAFDRATPLPHSVRMPVVAAPAPTPVFHDDPGEPTQVEEAPAGADAPSLEVTNPFVGADARARRRRVAFLAIAGAIALAAALVVAVMIAQSGGEDGAVAAAPVARTPIRTAGAEPAPAAPALAPTLPAATPSSAGTPSVSVTLILRSDPVGAAVFSPEGQRLGVTPFTASVERGSGARSYIVRQRRFRDRRVEWSAEADDVSEVKLRPAPAGTVARPDGRQSPVHVVPPPDPDATDNPFRKKKGP